MAVIAVIVLIGIVWLFLSVSKTFEPTTFQKLRALITAISIPLVFFWFHNRQRFRRFERILSGLIVVAIIGGFAAGSALVIYQNVIQPPEWDFLTFWLNGQVAVSGQNFYEPEAYKSIELPMVISPAYSQEILEVGFWYPPPTIFLFLPLGFLNIKAAVVLWLVAQSIVLAVGIILLWKTFLDGTGLPGLILTAGLLVIIAGTMSTFRFAQTSFIALLMILLWWKSRESYIGGFWLILAALVKPFLLVMFIVPLIRKNSRVLLGALASLAAISVLTIISFGPKTFVTYFTSNPASRVPGFVFTEVTNQSLLATVLRIEGYGLFEQSETAQIIFITTTFLLSAVTVGLLYLQNDMGKDWSAALVLVFALMVYPASQYFYSVLLSIPVLLLWKDRNRIPTGTWGVTALIAAIFVVTSFAGFVFLAYLLTWSATVALLSWPLLNRRFAAKV